MEQCLIPKKWDHQRTHKIFLILSRLCTPCPKKKGLRIWSTSTSVLFNSTQQIGRCCVMCMIKKIQYTVANWMSIFCQIGCQLFGKKYHHITEWSFFEVEHQTNPKNNCFFSLTDLVVQWKKIWTHPNLHISTWIYGKIFKLLYSKLGSKQNNQCVCITRPKFCQLYQYFLILMINYPRKKFSY